MDVTTVLRVAFSLAVVLGLLWVSYRVASKTSRSAPRGRHEQLTVVARQGLSQKSAAVLLEAGGRRYLLGVTESSVTVIDGPSPVPSAAPPAPGTTADATPPSSRPRTRRPRTPRPRPSPRSTTPSPRPACRSRSRPRTGTPRRGTASPAPCPPSRPPPRPGRPGPLAGTTTTVVVPHPAPTSALRTFLAPDTWRKAARVVRGGAR